MADDRRHAERREKDLTEIEHEIHCLKYEITVRQARLKILESKLAQVVIGAGNGRE